MSFGLLSSFSGNIPISGNLSVTVSQNIDITGAYMTAIGGSITYYGNQKIHTFFGSGAFQVLSVGSDPNDGSQVRYMVIAGGGGGGRDMGGGGGQAYHVGNYGLGGLGGINNGTNGTQASPIGTSTGAGYSGGAAGQYTGGGGGGSSHITDSGANGPSTFGGNGGSGILVVKYKFQ